MRIKPPIQYNQKCKPKGYKCISPEEQIFECVCECFVFGKDSDTLETVRFKIVENDAVQSNNLFNERYDDKIIDVRLGDLKIAIFNINFFYRHGKKELYVESIYISVDERNILNRKKKLERVCE